MLILNLSFLNWGIWNYALDRGGNWLRMPLWSINMSVFGLCVCVCVHQCVKRETRGEAKMIRLDFSISNIFSFSHLPLFAGTHIIGLENFCFILNRMLDYQIYIFYCSLGTRLSKKNHASSIFCLQVSLTCSDIWNAPRNTWCIIIYIFSDLVIAKSPTSMPLVNRKQTPGHSLISSFSTT